jgi:hypothetical protein
MTRTRIQIVGRISSDRHRRVRALVKRRKVTRNAFVIANRRLVLQPHRPAHWRGIAGRRQDGLAHAQRIPLGPSCQVDRPDGR